MVRSLSSVCPALLAALALLACAATAVRAQTPGDADLSFETGSTINGMVYAVVPTGDGKVYIGGNFTSVRGGVRNRIARLNPDGTVDETFDPGPGVDNSVYSLALQPDGKVLIGGTFDSVRGAPRKNIARLNADGSFDTSFKPVVGPNNPVHSLALQADGKVLIGGLFTSYNGVSRNRIARLNSDGSLDTTFDPGTGANGTVDSIALRSDGRVLVGGLFTSYNGVSRNRIACLNTNGSLYATFDPGTGAGDYVYSIALRSDGKVLVGGVFTSYNGVSRNRIARLNINGSLDTSFNPGSGANGTVRSIALQPDGKVLVGGEFASYNGVSRNHIVRLNANGSLDTDFDPGTGVNAYVSSFALRSLALQPDGKVLVGGGFTSYNGTDCRYVARLSADGNIDTDFNPGTGANAYVSSIALPPDGKVLVGGGFTSYNGTGRNRIARLNMEGSLDTSFNPGSGANSTVYSLALQSDGKVLVAGVFTSYNGTGRNRIARLNVDGSLDTSFDPGTGANKDVYSLALQPDGKVLVGGDFTSYNGTGRNYIARLNTDGSLDTSFDPGTGTSREIHALALQADGKVLVGGYFTSYDGVSRNRIARLNPDGSLDTTFNPGTGADAIVRSFALQPDGKVLVGGWFTSYDGTGRNRIARLNVDGSLDTTFNPGTGANGGGVYSLALQSDGKVLVGGQFTSYDGTGRNCVARLNVDGSLDTDFNPGTGANAGAVGSLALQPDGKVIVGGGFGGYNGAMRTYLARAHNGPASQSLTAASPDRVEWLRGGSAPEVGQVVFERSPDGVAWTPLGTATHIPGGWELTGLNLKGDGHLRARGRATGSQYNGSSSPIEQTIPYSFPAPEITVSGNETDIANGDDTPDEADHTAFGDASVPGEPVVRTFAIANTGEVDLDLTGDPLVEFDGSPAFSLIPPFPSATIAPGGTQSFQIAFAPSTSGPHLATVRIASDGGDRSPFTFAIGGTGVLVDTAVTFTDGLAVIGRRILPGDLHRFQLSLDGPRMLSVVTTGGAALRADLRDGAGHLVASFGNGGDLGFRGALLAGSYVLEIHRQPGEDPAQDYELTLDASTVASVRPEVVVGTAPTRLTGKIATVVSKKARPVKAHARVANRGNLPDTLAVRAGKGNALFKVVWLAPGNATAALTTGSYRTATLGEGATAPIQVSVKPNKKKLTKKKAKLQVIQKKTLNLPVTVWSTYDPGLKDAATIRVRTK